MHLHALAIQSRGIQYPCKRFITEHFLSSFDIYLMQIVHGATYEGSQDHK